MSYTIDKIKADIAEEFAKKYGVCIDGGMPKTATGLEALCHRIYNKGWADCRERMLNKRWIPCSERLPEEDECVLVQPRWAGEKFELIIAWRGANMWTATDGWGHENGYLDNDEVIAWMPLPEAYKGETE